MNEGPRLFAFRFEPVFRAAGAVFGVRPSTARVTLSDTTLLARFGPWVVTTPLDNVAGVQVTGPYASLLKNAGPAHLSMVDQGLTFATNRQRGVCICFAEPVRGLDPWGRLRHPGLTVTVADIDGLVAALGH